MKDFLTYLIEWKTYACFSFTGFTVVFALIALFFGMDSVSIAVLFQILLVAAVCSFLQMLVFTELLFKKMRYSLRLSIFFLLLFAVLTIFALSFAWFPSGNIGAWFSFLAIFCLISLGVTIGFEIYFRITGRRYNHMLASSRKEENTE